MMVSLRAPLVGISLSEESSAALVEQLDPQLVKAPQLNYALLSLGVPQTDKDGAEMISQPVTTGNLLAAGGTARVYGGSYKGQPLAIKLIYCLDLTPDIIRNFGREANKLASLSRNEHVVNLVGICVRPPSLAMALELCHYGSLTDVLQRYYHPVPNTPRDAKKYIEMSNRRTRLITALHCARGVAAMHSLRPPLLHLDIKAQNFLVALRPIAAPPSPLEIKTNNISPSNSLTTGDKAKSASLTTNRSGSSGSIAARQVVDEQVKFIVKIADLELSTHRGDPHIRIPDTYQWTGRSLIPHLCCVCLLVSDMMLCVM
jgi:serine/threonine protein kinase